MESVGLQTQVPDYFGKISQILGIKEQQQALQGQAAHVKNEQQTQRQRQALSQYDYTQHLDENGLMDVGSMLQSRELRQAAGDQFVDVLSHAAGLRQQQIQNVDSMRALRTEQRKEIAAGVAGLRNDPDVAQDNEKGRQKVNDALIKFGEDYGKDVLPVIASTSKLINDTHKGALGQTLKSLQMQALSADQLTSAQGPSYVNTGSQLEQQNPNAVPGAQPQTRDLTISPGEQNQLNTDQLGNPYQVQRDRRGNILGASGLGGSPGGPATFGPGERAAIEAQSDQNFKNVNQNRAAASQAPQQLDQIDKALALSRETNTGGWAQTRGQVESKVGSLIPGFSGADDATRLQLLDKFSERIAADASKVLGSNASTDAARESIHRQNANIGYTKQAVQSVLEYAKSQTLAVEAKGNAQEAWLKSEGNGITKQHEFETAFRKAYDPRVFQYAVMSPEEKKSYISKLSKEDGAALAEKTRALRALGALPNGR